MTAPRKILDGNKQPSSPTRRMKLCWQRRDALNPYREMKMFTSVLLGQMRKERWLTHEPFVHDNKRTRIRVERDEMRRLVKCEVILMEL